MSHYLITTHDERVFLAPDCPDPLTALAFRDMPSVCDIAAIDEWHGDCTWLNVYSNEKPVVTHHEPIIITVAGGLIDSVVSRTPIPNDIMVIDYDTYSMDKEDLSPAPEGDTEVYLYGAACRRASETIANYIDNQINRA